MKKILFVCTENSCRSQMAEAMARIHGQGIVEVYSAGSSPSGEVNPEAIALLREVNYDLSAHRSKTLADIPPGPYDWAITMGCGDSCPHVQAHHRTDWQIPDPKHMPTDEFRKIRNLIEEKTKALIEEISNENN